MRTPVAEQPNISGAQEQTEAQNGHDSGAGLSIGDIVHMLGRHKLLIVLCGLLGTGIALAYVLTATPIYEASTTLRIDPQRASSLGFSDLISAGGLGDPSTITATEIAILHSDAVVTATLNSLSDEDFRQFTGRPKSSLTVKPGAMSLPRDQEALLGAVKRDLAAKQIEGTQLVSVSFRSPNPNTAAMMVNHVMASYLRQNFDSRYGSVEQVTEWLSQQLDELRERAATAQRDLAAFQEKNNILGVDAANNTTIDRLRQLNSRLTEAQSERIVKEAQMRAAQSANLAVLSSMLANPVLTGLQTQQTALYNQYVQLSTKFDRGYPPLAELKQQMQAVDAEIERAKVEQARTRLQQEFNAALSAERMLQGEYNDQTEKAYALNREQAQYAVLQAEGNSSRDLYDTLQYKLKQAGVDAGLNGINTMIVDIARAPLIPVEPKKTIILTFGIVLGLFAGLAAAFFKEAVADSVQNGEQVERLLGYRVIAAIPQFKSEQQMGKTATATMAGTGDPITLVTYKAPLSHEAEAYRALRNSVLLSSLNHPFKSILITSGLAGEGKSTTVANYAVVLAQHGAKVLAIDADLRRPRLHTYFGILNNRGLGDLLLDDALTPSFATPLPELPNLSVLPAGIRVALPSEALGSNKLRNLIAGWEKEFDFLVIDSAPVLVVSDTLPMANYVDALILVIRYNKTPVRFLRRLRSILTLADAHVAGAVINEISDAGATYGGYGYANSEYYH